MVNKQPIKKQCSQQTHNHHTEIVGLALPLIPKDV